eukprot:SAG31_NODE_11177_length_1058_cov_0.937435_1_plen_41_part_10
MPVYIAVIGNTVIDSCTGTKFSIRMQMSTRGARGAVPVLIL